MEPRFRTNCIPKCLMVCLITPWMTRNLDTFNKNLGIMNEIKDKHPEDFKVEVLSDSIKFYLPRVEGYLEVIRDMASKYRGMSLIEFDGYFEGKFEPVKYIRAEIHTSDIDEQNMINFANDIRLRLRQKSLAIEFNNRLILISEN